LRVKGLGFAVHGLGGKVQGFGSGFQGLWFMFSHESLVRLSASQYPVSRSLSVSRVLAFGFPGLDPRLVTFGFPGTKILSVSRVLNRFPGYESIPGPHGGLRGFRSP